MKTATVMDFQNHFADIFAWVGEASSTPKRMAARLDFRARLRKNFPNGPVKQTSTDEEFWQHLRGDR